MKQSCFANTCTLAVAFSLLACAAVQAHDAALERKARAAIERGAAYLARQQAEDGGWHSATYGQLKGGPGVTALALYALSRTPADVREKHLQLARRGYDFFTPGFAKRRTLAAADGSLDYPTYAAALWLLGRERWQLPAGDAEERAIVDYLLAAQVLEPRSFQPTSPSYGGWDFLGPDDARGITTGTNISLAAYILEALATLDDDRPGVKEARKHSLAWVERTQQQDGGFAFTPEPGSLNNKAQFADAEEPEASPTPRSYGTATCDGIRSLLAAGVSPDDARMQQAVAWLAKRPGLDVVPGFEALPPEAGWQRGLRFYYFASLADVLKHFPVADREVRRRELLETLLKEQRDDGSWVNESARMREDDPLIATSFAVAAIGALLEQQE